MRTSRRTILRVSALTVPAAVLAGCNVFQAPSISAALTALQTDARDIVTGLQGVLPAIAALGASFAPAVATINKDIGLAASYLPTLDAFANISDATGTTQQITTAISDALKVAAGLPIPQPYEGAILAAGVLLPLVLSEAGLPAPASAMSPKAAAITPDQARRVLRLAAQGKL